MYFSFTYFLLFALRTRHVIEPNFICVGIYLLSKVTVHVGSFLSTYAIQYISFVVFRILCRFVSLIMSVRKIFLYVYMQLKGATAIYTN
jgi:hypothetical protein